MVAILVLGCALAILDARMLPAAPWARSLGTSAAAAAAGTSAWLLIAPVTVGAGVGDLFLPIAALAGVASFLATVAVRSGGSHPLATVLFAGTWSALVFVPAAFLTFVGLPDFRPTDHGGSIVMNVAGGAATLGVLVVMRTDVPRLRPATVSLPLGVGAVVTLCVAWIAWLVGAELAIDEVTPNIILNALIGALGGAAGWLIVQRIRHQRTTLAAFAAGIVAGLVSITSGAAFYTPLFAAIAGLVAGAVACLFTLRRTEASRRQQWFIVGSHLVAGGIGVALLGVLATGTGYIYTGDTGITFTGIFSFFERQVISTVAVAVYSALVAALLWILLRLLGGVRSR